MPNITNRITYINARLDIIKFNFPNVDVLHAERMIFRATEYAKNDLVAATRMLEASVRVIRAIEDSCLEVI